MQAEVAEQREDAAARVGLHRVAQGEAERRREGERLAAPPPRARRGRRRSTACRSARAPRRRLGGDVSGAAVGAGAFHPLEFTASRLPLEVLPALVLESRQLCVPHRSEQRRDSTMRATFQGSIVALVTPFRNGKVDEAKLRELVEFHVASGTDGIVPCGTTGESPTLSHDEHKRVVELVIETARGRRAGHRGHRLQLHRRGHRPHHARQEGGRDRRARGQSRTTTSPPRKGSTATSAPWPRRWTSRSSSTTSRAAPRSTSRRTPWPASSRDCPNIVGVKEASGSLDQMTQVILACGPDFSRALRRRQHHPAAHGGRRAAA